MRTSLLTIVFYFLLLLSACNSSVTKVELVEVCIQGGQVDPMLCDCLVSRAAKELNGSGMAYLATALQGHQHDAAVEGGKLAYSQAMRASRLLANAPGQCAIEGSINRKGALAGY